ncbi:Hypothetical protein ORPV_1068 [Orpheovirus IHUMI-LCC2]|uniref:Uncharacterized protein n=1 Tax=Orpheovirus IHUMI-LCC2 TaxID=2023057 RepID=A0A2I2L5Z5_9VIRU|nr:Hypothetical protein ORPV_1068 [Orpheovirus IHUMI-LCC2]SNW62972.1 Hypothetical protein ORPV_1068 [Orpheovirus IHUMI-LCC2]
MTDNATDKIVLDAAQEKLLRMALRKNKTFISSHILCLLKDKCNEEVDNFIENLYEHEIGYKYALSPAIYTYSSITGESDVDLYENYISKLGITLDFSSRSVCNYNKDRKYGNIKVPLTDDEVVLYKYILSLVLTPTEYITYKGLITLNFNFDLLIEIQSGYDLDDWFMEYVRDDLDYLSKILYIQNC